MTTAGNPKSQKLTATTAEINKKHGAGTVVLGREIRHDMVPRMPSGSLSLDVALGGGWPANQWNEIIGEESAGKTVVALKTVAENQRRDPNWICVWVASETFVASWAETLGCDLDRMLIVDEAGMEVAYNIVIKYAESKEVDCIVIDSLPALVPERENEGDMVDLQVGLGALLSNKFFVRKGKMKRSLVSEERPILGLIINQFREKIGVMRGDPRTTPGGKGKNFAYFSRVEVKRADWILDNKTRVGQIIKANVFKNKSAAPHKIAMINFYFTDFAGFKPGDYDIATDIFNVGVYFDVIRHRGGGNYEFQDRLWKAREGGQHLLRQDITEDEKLRNQLEEEILSLTHRKHKEVSPRRRKVSRRKQ